MRKGAIRVGRNLVICLLTIHLFTAAALAQTDGFVSNAGVFDYLSPPEIRPQKNVQPSDGWIGVYYAPGAGLEMNIWDLQEGEGTLHCSVTNYANPNETARDRIHASICPADGGMKDTAGGFTLHDFHDGTFTMDIDDSWAQWLDSRGTPIYGDPVTIMFTDVTKLMADPAEDRFGGAYFCDVMEDHSGTEVYADETHYLSFVQLYGTGDYYMVSQRVIQGTENTGSRHTVFLVDSDGALIHNHGNSIVTGTDYIERYVLHDAEPQRFVTQYIGDDGMTYDYYRCSSQPMWED